MIPSTADRPNPHPVNFVVKKGSKILLRTSVLIPEPLSVTLRSAYSPSVKAMFVRSPYWTSSSRLLTLGREFGWSEVYRAIDEAAKYGKMNYACVEAIVDKTKRADNQARKEKSWEEDFVNGLK